jgi:hypothetical protein
MTTETKPAVALSIFFINRQDIVKLYNVALEASKENKVVFQGIFPWNLANPNRDVEYASFVVEPESLQKIIDKIKLALNLAEESLLYTVAPSTLPKEKPIPTDAIR